MNLKYQTRKLTDVAVPSRVDLLHVGQARRQDIDTCVVARKQAGGDGALLTKHQLHHIQPTFLFQLHLIIVHMS